MVLSGDIWTVAAFSGVFGTLRGLGHFFGRA